MQHRLCQALLAAAIFVSLLLTAAHAEDIAAQTIILDSETGVSDSTLPAVTVTPGSGLALKVMNFSPKPLVLNIAELNVNQTVPPNTEQLLSISPTTTAGLTPGQPIAYDVTDADGNRLASGTLTGEEAILASLFTSSSSQVSEQIIETEPEPRVQKKSAVRGFW